MTWLSVEVPTLFVHLELSRCLPDGDMRTATQCRCGGRAHTTHDTTRIYPLIGRGNVTLPS
jgi:hypothetical protein